jgi:uncharacterized protein (TIGR02611 family)
MGWHWIVIATVKGARRIIITVVGATVVLIGIAMIVLPGPAVVVIPAGLAILATEFIWARRLLHRIKRETRGLANGAKGFFGRKKTVAPDTGDTPEKKRGG